MRNTSETIATWLTGVTLLVLGWMTIVAVAGLAVKVWKEVL